jgi:hypothetical protein
MDSNNNKNIYIAIGVVVLILVIIIVTFLLYYFLVIKKKKESSPSPPSPSSPSSPVSPAPANPIYLGCFADSSKRDLPNLIPSAHNIQECNAAAKAGGYKYFGLQDFTDPDGRQCWTGNSFGSKGPSSTPCIKNSQGIYEGGAFQNAVYETSK